MREVRVNCRLTPDEKRKLATAACAVGVPPATLLRMAGFAYLDQRFLLPPQIEDVLRSLIRETRRIGTNLNQIAAKANTLRRVTGGDLRTARKAVGEFEEQFREFETLLRSLRPNA